MRCAFPVHVEREDGSRYARGCGKCVACRDTWMKQRCSRMEFELLRHPHPEQWTFVRLSYDDDHLPRTPTGQATLDYADRRKFIDSLRRKVGHPIMWAAKGEYGTKPTDGRTYRPHFHLLIGNIPTKWCQWQEPNPERRERFDREIRRDKHLGKFTELHGLWQLLLSAWKWRGQVHLQSVDVSRHPRYLVKYMGKQWRDADGFAIGEAPWDDREPEKLHLGRGWGAGFVPIIADMLKRAKRYPRGWPEPGPEWEPLDLQVKVNGRTLWLDSWMKQQVARELCPERSEEFKRAFADQAHREAYAERDDMGLAFDNLADLATKGATKEKPPPRFLLKSEPGGGPVEFQKLETLEIETDGIIPRSQAEIDKENRTLYRRRHGLKANAWQQSIPKKKSRM